jgi:hypothetical protein
MRGLTLRARLWRLSCVLGLGLAGTTFALLAREASAKPKGEAELAGQTYDFAWDGRDRGEPEHAWLGRAWVPEELSAEPDRPAPLLIFLHGLNRELIPYRWMGGGHEGDVRRIVAKLIAEGRIPPTLVAAPSSVLPWNKKARSSWPSFDVDHFLELTREELRGKATIDSRQVLLVGHSGAGCDPHGGLALAKRARTAFQAVLSLDTCMGRDLAEALGSLPPPTEVVVTYQDQSWGSRPFAQFRLAFERASLKSDAPSELRSLRRLEPQGPGAHDALVHLTLNAELPRLLSRPQPR